MTVAVSRLARAAGYNAAALAITALVASPWYVSIIILYGLPLMLMHVTGQLRDRRVRRPVLWLLPLVATYTMTTVARRTNAWTTETAFPLLPGSVSVEELLWAYLYFALVITTDLSVFGSPRRRSAMGNAGVSSYLLLGGVVLPVLCAVPSLPRLIGPYSYAVMGTLMFLPVLVVAFIAMPMLRLQLLGAVLFWLPLHAGYEVIAVARGYWSFPGRYLQLVPLPGVTLPVEEILFLIVLCAPAVVATHHLFPDLEASAGVTDGR